MELTNILSGDVLNYAQASLAVLGGIVMIASAIAPFTKTTKDDEAVAWLRNLIQRFSVVKPKA